MRRFNREARITAPTWPPGVPVLYDFGTDQGELFMVIEHVTGMTIADLIAEDGPVPVPWAATIIAQVLRGARRGPRTAARPPGS